MENNIELIRETLENYEGNGLSDISLIGAIVGVNTANKLKALNIHSLLDIKVMEISELRNLKGIGGATLSKLLALVELSKRMSISPSGVIVSAPATAFSMCKDLMHEEQEVFRLLCLNTKNRVIRKVDLFKGGLNMASVDTRIVLREAIKCSSASIIISHNHPSGDPSPSKEDINITARIKEASRIIGISLLDHIIVGKGSHCSMKEKGLI